MTTEEIAELLKVVAQLKEMQKLHFMFIKNAWAVARLLEVEA